MSGMIKHNIVTGSQQRMQKFVTPGDTTWTKPSGITMVYIECIGGGGGGGGGQGYNREGAAGGGGGALSRYTYPAESLPNTLTITVGAAGTGGLWSGDAHGGNGGTSFV